jgi:hypothetical protein
VKPSPAYTKLEAIGHTPKPHVLDNECSHAVKNFCKIKNTAIQQFKAHHHSANAAEPAAKSIKYHIFSCIVIMDASCPIQLWSEMIPQMQDTLNMLRTSRNNNKLTAYEKIKGAFDWNRVPMAPLGNKCVVYVTLDIRNTYAPHCDKAYTVERAPNHHQLLKCYVPTTMGYRISGTYHPDPSYWMFPAVSEQNMTVSAATDLLVAFQKFIPTLAADKQKHIATIRNFAAVLCNNLNRKRKLQNHQEWKTQDHQGWTMPYQRGGNRGISKGGQ